MRIGKRAATLAASGALLAATIGFGTASPAQADTCDLPPAGSMCLHIHNTSTDTWYWFGPWSTCTVHNIPAYDQVTWINNNQVGGVRTTFYAGRDATNPLGSVAQDYSGRPPGYVDSNYSATQSVRVC
ncbi:hypothetical protein AB0O31_10540 [Kitasatospora cineracea]|uniref:hypothetical protein n=1 Tax=Kitasatospora cineracea TaxID=88074 RepID=UPI003422B350